MTFWLLSGWDQKSGDEICSSVAASSFFFLAASKIAPHGRCLFLERRVFAVKFVEIHFEWNLHFSNCYRINHAVAVGEETVALLNSVAIGGEG